MYCYALRSDLEIPASERASKMLGLSRKRKQIVGPVRKKDDDLALNNYCDRCHQIRDFVLRRTNQGTFWECEKCGFRIFDIAKYDHNYYGLPVNEITGKVRYMTGKEERGPALRVA